MIPACQGPFLYYGSTAHQFMETIWKGKQTNKQTSNMCTGDKGKQTNKQTSRGGTCRGVDAGGSCHAPSQLDPGELSHMCIHLMMDHDSTQLNALPCMGNAEHSPTWTSLGRQGQRIDSVHDTFIHLTYNTL